MTEGTVTDVIVARSRIDERSNSMIPWSIAAHIALFAFMIFMPASWRGAVDEGPHTVMTISVVIRIDPACPWRMTKPREERELAFMGLYYLKRMARTDMVPLTTVPGRVVVLP